MKVITNVLTLAYTWLQNDATIFRKCETQSTENEMEGPLFWRNETKNIILNNSNHNLISLNHTIFEKIDDKNVRA